MITGNPALEIKTSPRVSSTNVISKLWTMVMEKVMDVMDYVMAESTASDECDRCDGIFKKSSEKDDNVESEIECNTVNQGQLEKNDSVKDFSILPSHTSQKEVESYINQGVTDT